MNSKINLVDKEWIKLKTCKSKEIKNDIQKENKFLLKNIGINNSDKNIDFKLQKEITLENKKIKSVKIRFDGEVKKGAGATAYLNGFAIPIDSVINMALNPPINLELKITVMNNTEVTIKDISLEFIEKESNLIEEWEEKGEVLVVTPSYPTPENLYLCGFVHARVREYVKAGLKVDVATIDDSYWYQTIYTINGVKVFKGKYSDLKTLIGEGKYKTIVLHFSGEKCYQVLDGYRTNERLIFINHGAEILIDHLPEIERPYFIEKAIDNSHLKELYEKKKQYIKKYAIDLNTTWVFVSEYLQKEAEEVIGTKFNDTRIIHNLINEELFPYKEKTEDKRKNILIIRKFDNLAVHSIDQSILAILELSRRELFKDLVFNIYGDGNFFEDLIMPIKEFENVNIYRQFLTHEEISKVHEENGILLLPSRHDSQGVSMGEGASSGLVVVGSDTTAVGDFMNVEVNHTLAHPERADELADIIERLYYNPGEFLELSKRMSKEMHDRCGIKETVEREIGTIKEACLNYRDNVPMIGNKYEGEKVLTIIIPSYNIEVYIHKCLFSLLNHRNAYKTEILLINDGSKDNTLKLAQNYEEKYPEIIRVIDKENGGHGSTINVGIQEAKGRYFRIIDGDDWVDSENLAKQIDRLEDEIADIVLTKGCYEYVEEADLQNIIRYNSIKEGPLYYFDDLTYPHYGFVGYGPILSTSTYKTEKLRQADFKITEKSAYVDMEFNAFTLKEVNTLRYYDLDIYRYLIGRVGQTVSKEFWSKKYKQHENIIFNLIRFINQNVVSERKKIYIIEHLIAPMIDSQVFMYGQIKKYDELGVFLNSIKANQEVYKKSIKFIESKQGDSWVIINQYNEKNQMNWLSNVIKPIKKVAKLGKKSIKAIVPYGIIRIYQKKKYKI